MIYMYFQCHVQFKKKKIAVYVKYVLMSIVCSCKAVKITLHLFALY